MKIRSSMNSFVITKSGLKRVYELNDKDNILGINTNGKEEWAEVEIKEFGKEDCYLLLGDCFYGTFPQDNSIFTTNGLRKISAILKNYKATKVEYIRNISEKGQIKWHREKPLAPLLEAVMLRVKKVDPISSTILLVVPTHFYESPVYFNHINMLSNLIKGTVIDSTRGPFWSWVKIKLTNYQGLLTETNALKGHQDWLSYYLETAVDGKIDSIIEEEDIHSGIIFGLILKGASYKISYSPLYSPIDINFRINESKLPYSNIKSIIIKKNQSIGIITSLRNNWYPIVNFIPVN